MLKELLLKKMMQRQLGGLSAKQQEKIIRVISENPELFKKIGLELQNRMKNGGNQMTVAAEIMQKYKDQLREVF